MKSWFWERQLGKQTYRMSKVLFALLCFLVLGTSGLALFVSGGVDDNMFYVSCPNRSFNGSVTGLCKNPLFNSSHCGVDIPFNSSFCSQEFIGAGESLGVPSPWLVSYFSLIVFFEFALVFLVNHFCFNRGFVIEGDV